MVSARPEYADGDLHADYLQDGHGRKDRRVGDIDTVAWHCPVRIAEANGCEQSQNR